MRKPAFYVVNGITAFRLIAFPVLMFLLVVRRFEIFAWLLGVSFFTDAIDGWLSRKLKVVSVFGARLDSIGDDLTVLAGIIGVLVIDAAFFWERWVFVALLLLLLLVQITAALVRYRKLTSFHTYLAKLAAVVQGLFLLAFFFFPDYASVLFLVAFSVTALDLLEEILLVFRLTNWQTDVKGLFWLSSATK